MWLRRISDKICIQSRGRPAPMGHLKISILLSQRVTYRRHSLVYVIVNRITQKVTCGSCRNIHQNLYVTSPILQLIGFWSLKGKKKARFLALERSNGFHLVAENSSNTWLTFGFSKALSRSRTLKGQKTIFAVISPDKIYIKRSNWCHFVTNPKVHHLARTMWLTFKNAQNKSWYHNLAQSWIWVKMKLTETNLTLKA